MEILGLLDTLESVILDSFKIPLTGKVLVDEQKVLSLLEKVRLVAQRGDGVVRQAISKQGYVEIKSEEEREVERALSAVGTSATEGKGEDPQALAVETIRQAYQLAREVRVGADRYADEVLANLEATSARILRTIRNGRMRISKFTGNRPAEPLTEPRGEMGDSMARETPMGTTMGSASQQSTQQPMQLNPNGSFLVAERPGS